AALLHDVGRLVYMKIYPRYYETVIAYQKSQECSLIDAELALGVPSHTTMGAALANKWQLPEVIQDVCMNYHMTDPTAVPGSETQISFRRLVGTASRLIDLANEALSTELRDRTRREVRKGLKITQSEFLGLMGEVYDLRAEADAFVQE
ncbi:MAG: HDOD domain-containing protein, partial [Myxococcota bacterium]|nr:HDOD domain-containing protein [Myxococcota bacterium]